MLHKNIKTVKEGISPLITIRAYLCKQLQWELLFYSEPCAAVVTIQLFWGAIFVNHITVWFLHICAALKFNNTKKRVRRKKPTSPKKGWNCFLFNQNNLIYLV